MHFPAINYVYLLLEVFDNIMLLLYCSAFVFAFFFSCLLHLHTGNRIILLCKHNIWKKSYRCRTVLPKPLPPTALFVTKME